MTHIENKSICLLRGYDTVGELQTYQPLHEETSLYDQLHSLMQMVGGVTTVFAGETFEWTGSTATMKKYYYAGQRRVAMRVGSTLERITFNTTSWKG